MVLGIDTSGTVCSVAIVNNQKLICEFSINHQKTHSAMLLPILDSMLKASECSLEEIELIAVANGPGSFTGLRIGAATAKGLSFSLNKPIVGVGTLEALSYNLCDSNAIIVPIMDARRNEVYTGAFDYTLGTKKTFDSPVISPTALPIGELLDELASIDKVYSLERQVMFLGDGVPVYQEFICENARFHIGFAGTGNLLQRASSVALLGELRKEQATSSEALELAYIRRPQAERERLGL